MEVFLRNPGNMLLIHVWGSEEKFKLKLYVSDFVVNKQNYKMSDLSVQNLQRKANNDRRKYIGIFQRWEEWCHNALEEEKENASMRKIRVARNKTSVFQVFGRSNPSDKLYMLNEEQIKIIRVEDSWEWPWVINMSAEVWKNNDKVLGEGKDLCIHDVLELWMQNIPSKVMEKCGLFLCNYLSRW